MGTGYVILSDYWWRRFENARREELIMHELGHCVLDRYHDNSVDGGGTPLSVMNWSHLGPSVYANPARYPRYIAELFSVPEAVFTGITFDESRYPAASVFALGHDDQGFDCQHDGNGTFTVTLPTP
jgi:hypothetical protein